MLCIAYTVARSLLEGISYTYTLQGSDDVINRDCVKCRVCACPVMLFIPVLTRVHNILPQMPLWSLFANPVAMIRPRSE